MLGIQADKSSMDFLMANKFSEICRIVGNKHKIVFDGASNDAPIFA